MAKDFLHIKKHFREVDPVIYKIMKNLDFGKWMKRSPKDQYFSDLCEAIITQQLSDKAAATIIKRFYRLFPAKRIYPNLVLRLEDKKLRHVGMSWSKAAYIKNLAQAVATKEIKLERLDALEDEKVTITLSSIKGIGSWTAEMFLIFSLGREDVFSFGDQGLKKAIISLYKLKAPSKLAIEKIVKPWSPYRSYASLTLWHFLDERN